MASYTGSNGYGSYITPSPYSDADSTYSTYGSGAGYGIPPAIKQMLGYSNYLNNNNMYYGGGAYAQQQGYGQQGYGIGNIYGVNRNMN